MADELRQFSREIGFSLTRIGLGLFMFEQSVVVVTEQVVTFLPFIAGSLKLSVTAQKIVLICLFRHIQPSGQQRQRFPFYLTVRIPSNFIEGQGA